MASVYGKSAHAVALSGFSIAERLLEVLRAKDVLSREDVANLLNAAAADANALNTVTGTEAVQILNALAEDGETGNA